MAGQLINATVFYHLIGITNTEFVLVYVHISSM